MHRVIRKIFKTDLLEKKASNKKILLILLDLFFRVELPSLHPVYIPAIVSQMIGYEISRKSFCEKNTANGVKNNF